jgi:hypothetical protein
MEYKDVKMDGIYYYADPAKTIYHRDDGPAIEYVDGSYSWYRNGSLHRMNGPAYKNSIGDLFWFRNGHKHNALGPAVILHNGDRKEWWIQGKKHRLDGPAVESKAILEWWFKGKLHRLDGPAFYDQSGLHPPRYFIGGKYLAKEEWLMQISEEARYKMLFDSDFITTSK